MLISKYYQHQRISIIDRSIDKFSRKYKLYLIDYLTHYTPDHDKPPLPKSLHDILPGTLQQHPPKIPLTRQYSPIEMARWVAAQRHTNSGNRKMSREERHDIRRYFHQYN